MEYRGQKVEKKYDRTSPEQLEHYIYFLQENPDFLVIKNHKTDPNKTKKYWDMLTKELNSLRGPVRTAAKWKQTLSHWKHQLRSRARKIKKHQNLTAGGTPLTDRLSTFDEKALEVFGTVAVDALKTIPKIECDEESVESSPATPVSLFPFTCEDMTEEESTCSTAPASSKNSAQISTNDICSKVVELCERTYEMEKVAQVERHQIQLQILKNQEAMTEALRKVGEGLTAISHLVHCLLKQNQHNTKQK